MTVQDIIDALSDYGFTDTTTTRKMEKINAAVWDLCGREAWPFLEATVDLTFDGVNSVPTNLPADFQSVLDIIDTTDSGTKLQPLLLQEADAAISMQLTQSGTPIYYYFIAGQLNIAQVPVAGTVLRMRYIRKHPQLLQTDVEAAILVPREHHEVIEFATLVKLYDMEDDTDLSVRFQQLYEKGINDMRQSVWMRQYDRPQHIQVTDVYDYDLDYYA
jgi:hypothetical protein